MHEMRLAIRRARSRPGRSVIAVLTLALGIGTSTAMFSAVQGVLISPLAVEAQDDLVVLWHVNPARAFAHVPLRAEAARSIADATTVFTGVAAFETVGTRPASARTSGALFPVEHARVAGDFFGVLGARPAAGRLLDAADDEPGAPPVVVVSHDYWVRTTGADPGLVGSTLEIRDRAYTVVGVTGDGFDFPVGAEVWVPLRAALPDWAPGDPTELDIVGRLGSGVSGEEAGRQTNEILSEHPEFSSVYGELDPVVLPLEEHVVGSFAVVLESSMAAAMILMLVAVANATLLFLAGGARSRAEIAVRRALGAAGRAVHAPLMADAAVVAGLATLLGVGLAWLAVETLVPLAPLDVPRVQRVALDGSAVLFAVATGVGAMVVAGGLAGLWLSRGTPQAALVGGGRGSDGGGEALRRVIAATQLGLAVVAALGAGLLVRSVGNLGGLEWGFAVEDLYLVRLDHGFDLFQVPERYPRVLEAVSSDLGASPGVLGATPTLNAPLDFNDGLEMAPTLEGQDDAAARANPYVSLDAVLPNYFALMGMEVREGRPLSDQDRAGAPRAVVVNESAARALWPGARAIGRRLKIYPGLPDEWGTVVGIVRDTRYRSFPEPRPAAWVPLAQYSSIPPGRLLVRASAGGGSVVRAQVTAAFAEHASDVRVLSVDRVDGILDTPVRLPRFAAAVLLGFATATLVLACLGVYGVFSVLVQERGRELGVRRALGAQGPDLVRFVASRVLLVGLAGAVTGLGAGVGLVGWLDALLYGVEPADPATLVTTLVGALLLALVAGAVPAARAVRADPVRALHTE